MLPQISDKLKKAPIGTIARRYIFPVILTVLRPSSSVVVLDIICVIMVAKVKCQHVSVTG